MLHGLACWHAVAITNSLDGKKKEGKERRTQISIPYSKSRPIFSYYSGVRSFVVVDLRIKHHKRILISL